MKKRTRILRSDLFNRVALISISAAFLAGCSAATERFGEAPVYTGGTDNQRAILGGNSQPSYQDIASGPGGTSAGLPQQSSQPVYTGSIPSQAPVPARAQPLNSPTAVSAAPLPAPSVSQPRQITPVATAPAPEVAGASWKGWTSTGGTRVPVRQGETVSSLSRRYGVPEKAVLKVNGLSSANDVQAGQSIIIPTYVHGGGTTTARNDLSGSAPVRLPSASPVLTTASVPQTAGSAPAPDKKPVQQPTFTQVQSGPAGASQPAPVTVSALPKRKPVGNRSLTTASIKTPSPAAPKDPAQPVRTVTNASVSSTETGGEARPTEPIQRPAIVASVDPVATEGPQFRWPVRGRIISEFGSKPGGARNDGVNLAVPEGTPVKAADDGTVIYSGNELKGYGNLVLIRHDDGWVSAYAHNSELKVKRGDNVRRGDVVGLAGNTGSVSQPQVHFELRKGNKPVDPLIYLPKS
ncbi:LysM domain-containing protein [Roseibium hamelinense]|uniref:LysM domain-containing protein n=1 Tax=Roseibium hamelinense TaxID=150831 RepID=A0A562THJ1_9HYPH|nr:M23 family metallopeptidase [Roseibium hamelinense]MTI45678.1 LysM peptidoglycan-binding domain-containing protein [Roseibium hamelinense]TWI93139.1 LysM domain-containing protein [Roseibium hamelinense]